MILRILSKKLLQSAKRFPVVAVTGPRQAGKTTLARTVFPKKPYASLEEPDTREFALSDPRGFLSQYPHGAVFDEVQRAPELFSYLQSVVDEKNKAGMFILTGSQQLLMMENLSQTLAGRVHILHLLPLSLEELQARPSEPRTLEGWLFKGMYPRLHDKKIPPLDWYPAYLQTYLERDVRRIKNIGDLGTFHRFLKMCAARTGQLVNLSSLAQDCGITHNTAKAWIRVLEASFIVHLLQPHHMNFKKRLVKMPKLYFYDTGLSCSLLGIENEKQILTHPLRGNLFETAVVGEVLKQRHNLGLPPNLYFWRDKTGNEMDLILEKGPLLIPVEIKSSQTLTEDSFRNLRYWNKIARPKNAKSFLIYAGREEQKRKDTQVIGWRKLAALSSYLS